MPFFAAGVETKPMGLVLIVTGTLTAAAGIGLLAPRQVLTLLFGVRTVDRTAILVARHWCVLIALVGGLLIYAGSHPQVRVPVMIAASAEKLVLAALVFASPLRKRFATVAIVSADVVMAALYVTLLVRPLP